MWWNFTSDYEFFNDYESQDLGTFKISSGQHLDTNLQFVSSGYIYVLYKKGFSDISGNCFWSDDGF